MLKHDSEQPLPAAQVRVTPEELTAALHALEADKQEAARHLEGTVPIGEVVSEMELEATPEEIWAEVQKQRVQNAAGDAAISAGESVFRKFVYRFTLSCAALAVGCSLLAWGFHAHSPAPIHVSSDNGIVSYQVPHKDVIVSSSHAQVTLLGRCRNLTVTGDHNTITISGSVEAVSVFTDGNTIHWTQSPLGATTKITDSGSDNKVGLSAR